MYVKIHIYINFSIYHRWIVHFGIWTEIREPGVLSRSEPDGVTGESQEEDLLKCQYARAIFRLWYQLFSWSTNKNCLFCPRTSEWVLVRVGLVYDPTQAFLVFHSWRVARDAPFIISFYFINWTSETGYWLDQEPKKKKVLACRTEVIFYFTAFSRRVGANARHAKPRLPRALVLEGLVGQNTRYLLHPQYTCKRLFTLLQMIHISTRIRFQSFPLNFLLFSQTKLVSRAKVNIVSTDIYIIHYF